MNSIRKALILLVAGGCFASATEAFAQAEIDPDHYEPPIHKVETQKPAHRAGHAAHQQNQIASNKHAAKAHHHHSRSA